MGKVDELIESMKAEESSATTSETPASAEPDHEESTTGTDQEQTNDGPKTEDDGSKGGEAGANNDDQLSRAEFSFRRKLEKMNQRHAAELAERDSKYNDLLKRVEELQNKVEPKEPVKTRTDFATDDEYIDYITDQRVQKILAERDGKDAERRAKEAEEAKKRQADEAELVEQRQKWIDHVGKSFEGDSERAQKFLSKIQYANRNGLGEILDACPVASDFLMNNRNGPKVFERMLDDKATFMRVFGGNNSPLDIYYELRNVERELSGQTQANTNAVSQKPAMPRLGKPGKQAGGGSKPDIFSDRDAMLSFIRR